MSSEIAQILIILVLLTFNGVFSMSEMAIVSARRTRLQEQARKGDKRAARVLALLEDPNHFLSTVQVGITLIGMFAGAFGGATLAEHLEPWLGRIAILAPYKEWVSVMLVVLAITYVSLIIGELVPKRLAMNNPENIAKIMARPMQIVSTIGSPIVKLLSLSTNAVLWILNVDIADEAPVTEEEIKVLIKQGTQAGTLEEVEREMIERVFRLGDKNVGALMTPRPDMEVIDLEDDIEEIMGQIHETIYSRLPIIDGDADEVTGILQIKDLIEDAVAGRPMDIQKHMLKPLLVPESMPALKVLELFKQSGMHIAIVINEYGATEGLVTLNDILEAIVGDLPSFDEEDEEPEVRQREDGSFLMDGALSLEDFKHALDVEDLDEYEEDNYQTLAGLVMAHMGKIPEAGDSFEWKNLRFEVLDMDGNRIDKVMVSRTNEEAQEA
jgi:putative hemolysin